MTEMADRLINLGLERTVLGQMLNFRLMGPFLAAGLERDDFYRHQHRLVWDAILAVGNRGEDPDLTTVGLELRNAGTLTEVQPAYFSALGQGMPQPRWENIVALVRQLRELATARAIVGKVAQLGTAVSADPSLVQTDVLADRLLELDAIRQRPIGSAQAMRNAEAQLAALTEELRRDQTQKLYLGVPTLDNILAGVHPGEVCGFMGRPGIGKTLLLGHIARAVAEREVGMVVFSLEMPAAQIVERLARALYEWDRWTLQRTVAAGAFDQAKYLRAFRTLILIDTPGLSLGQMESYLRQAALGPLRDIPIRLVMIDHLGLIGGDRHLSTYDRVSTQAREVKELAKRHQVAVLIAVQVNRETGGDGSKELGLGAARDSGVVEEAVDYLVAMRRLDRAQHLAPSDREKYRDVMFLSVVKNRHGALGEEFAVKMSDHDLAITEAPDLRITEQDLRSLRIGGGR